MYQYMLIIFSVYYDIINIENCIGAQKLIWSGNAPQMLPRGASAGTRHDVITAHTASAQFCLVTSQIPLSYKSASDEAFDITQCYYKDPSSDGGSTTGNIIQHTK